MTDIVERLREAAREIETDGTPSQVGLTATEAREAAAEIERLKEAWKLCEEMVKAEDDLIADLVNDERYLDAMKMDFPITNRMRSMLARAAQMDGEGRDG